MSLKFEGTKLSPKRGMNGEARKLTGIRLSKLKKSQNQITFGEDVLKELGITTAQIDGKLKAAITEGTGKQAGKLLVTFDGTDGEFLMRWSSAKRKTSANIMSSALPIAKAVASATYKVFPDEKAVVIALPDADAPAAPAPAGDATPAVEPELEDLRAY